MSADLRMQIIRPSTLTRIISFSYFAASFIWAKNCCAARKRSLYDAEEIRIIMLLMSDDSVAKRCTIAQLLFFSLLIESLWWSSLLSWMIVAGFTDRTRRRGPSRKTCSRGPLERHQDHCTAACAGYSTLPDLAAIHDAIRRARCKACRRPRYGTSQWPKRKST